MPGVRQQEVVPARRYQREHKARLEAEAIAERVTSELYTRARELERAQEELERSNRELELFAYVASHDLQEPLRMVASYCQLLERRYKEALGEDGREFVAYAVDGATRMQALINDLLTYSRIGREDRQLVPTEAAAVFERARVNLHTAIAESGATVTAGPLPVIMAAESELTRVFQNLIGNAIKFRGAHAPEVRVEAEPHGSEALFSVRDNGIGIAPEHAERVFAIFQRLHSREEYAGTGIGLAVCKKIVERHGGRIWLDSSPGEGTTFWFTLATPESEGP
jgi:light-regulated signal transduction histidine kinase (bacteriophytochrome)